MHCQMAILSVPALQLRIPNLFFVHKPILCRKLASSSRPLVITAKGSIRKESVKVRNRRMLKKYNGTAAKPRLSVFCSDKQLYAMLVDDQNKKCIFYGSTLQKSIRQGSDCSIAEAAERVGEELIKTCNDLKINEISYYDRNGLARGERMQAFEIAISSYGFMPR